MADSTLVPKPVTNDNRHPQNYHTTQKDAANRRTARQSPRASEKADTDGLPGVRESLEVQQFSPRVTALILQSWRSGTQKQYSIYIKKWKLFCCKKEINFMQASLNHGLDFLAELFEENLSYSSINTARSALSSLLPPVNGITFGCHPHVIRLMKGIYNKRPPCSRYVNTWDVNIVLNRLRQLSPVRDLSMKDLTLKLVMLMALVSAQRAQTLHLLDTDFMKLSEFSVSFSIKEVVKNSRPGKSLPVLVFRHYPCDRRLCVLTVLKEYNKRRKVKVITNKISKLFISYRAPYKAVSKDTISRWIKTAMHQSGIDTSIYKAHSTRAAATSKAKKMDVPIQDILAQAGWSNSVTFAKHYAKPIYQRHFAEAVLKF